MSRVRKLAADEEERSLQFERSDANSSAYECGVESGVKYRLAETTSFGSGLLHTGFSCFEDRGHESHEGMWVVGSAIGSMGGKKEDGCGSQHYCSARNCIEKGEQTFGHRAC